MIRSIEFDKMKSKMKMSGMAIVVVVLALVVSSLPASTSAQTKTLKAGFVYVGPIGDFGWTYAHDQGRLYAESELPWLTTVYAESVPEGDAARVIHRMFRDEHCDVVFTTSFGYMDDTIDAGKRYPDKILFHCSGYKRSANVGTYFAELYQIYYLNGLAAGALAKTDKLGYVAAYPTPEVKRHLNAFLLGAQGINPSATLDVRWIYEWYSITKAQEAAEALVSEGCSAIGYTTDSPTIPSVCEKHTRENDKGYPIYTFSHYSPMTEFASDAILSGQLVRWGPIYMDILIKIHEGIYTPENLKEVDYWDLLASGNVEMGSDFGVPINPKWIPALKAKMVKEKYTGKEMSAYDLIMLRLSQMKEVGVLFDPYTGPIYDTEGNLRIPASVRASHDDLWLMDWGVKGVRGMPE